MSASLSIEHVSKSFGGLHAIRDVTLRFDAGSLSAVIGPNGAGKTTLFNIVTGHVRPDGGTITLGETALVGRKPTDIVRLGVGRAFQVASLFPTFTVAEALAAAILSRKRALFDLWRPFPTAEARDGASQVMEATGLVPAAGRLCSTLSHGDRKLLDIAMALALQPKVLLLDEPTAGMGREESRRMIDRIHRLWQRARITLIFIEHDMDIVFSIAQSVRVLRYGAVLAEGTPQEIRTHSQVIEAYLGSES